MQNWHNPPTNRGVVLIFKNEFVIRISIAMNVIAFQQFDDGFLSNRICWENLFFIDSAASFDFREHICLPVLISTIKNKMKLINTNTLYPRLTGWDNHDKGFNLWGVVR